MQDLNHETICESGCLIDMVLSQTSIMSVYLDNRFNFIWVNSAYAAGCHREPSFFPGKNHFELYPNAENRAIFQHVVDSGEPVSVKAKPFEFPDQPERGVTYWDWTLVPVKDPAGRIRGLIFTLVDVTNRVRGEIKAREAAEFFRALFEQAIDGMLLADAETMRFAKANRQIQLMLGYTEEELLHMGVPDIHPADALPEVLKQFGKQKRGELTLSSEVPVKRKDGSILLVDISASSVEIRERHYALGLFRDITDRKRTEAALEKEQEMLRQAVMELARSNMDLEQFASVASHDLKEPLRMITGFMSLLKEHAGSRLDAKSAECIRFAEEGGERLQRLVDDLLAYSRVGVKGSLEAVDVGDAVNEALANLGASVAESGATIRCDPLPVIQASRMELVLVFQNLLGNAVKFRRVGVAPDIRVSAAQENHVWRFQVEDNGIGIDPEYRDRIFRIFERLHEPDKYSGTGIGLAICKKIVERCGGVIRVDSKRDRARSSRSRCRPDATKDVHDG